jgi:hypothetical protein
MNQDQEDFVPETQVASVVSQQIIDNMKADLNYFAATAMPDVFKFNYPPTLVAAWQWLVDAVNEVRAFPKLALGLPRGFGKTGMMQLFVLYCVLFTDKAYVVIISSTGPNAEKFMRGLRTLMLHQNILTLFGDWTQTVQIDRGDLLIFHFRGRKIAIQAIGSEGNIRGANESSDRPDLILMDDMQSKEDARSDTLSNALFDWMIGTLMKSKSPTGCMYIFVANMYPTPNSILRKLSKLSDWRKFIAPGILSDGTSLWEDLQPISQLLNEYAADCEAGKQDIFLSEVMNDVNIAKNKLVDPFNLPSPKHTATDIPIYKFIVIDPSNNKKNSDDVSIGCFYCYDITKPVCVDIDFGIMSPGDTIKRALQMAFTHGAPVIAVEANAYQYSLCWWFQNHINQHGIIGIQIVDIYSGRLSKNSRILQMFAQLASGDQYISEDDKVMLPIRQQILGFDQLKTDNTDGLLDLLTYAPKVIELCGADLIPPDILNIVEESGPLITNECF